MPPSRESAAVGIIGAVSSKLSAIPVDKRRQLVGILGVFAVLLIAIGAVAATDDRSPVIKAFVVIAVLLGLVVAVFAWGVMLTMRADLAESRLESAVEDAVAASGQRPEAVFGCGHDHDPDEMHVSDAHDCAEDGSGAACSHDCATCLLATAGHRPSPTPAARRPRPN
jgi:hypothetical protein